MTPEFRAVDLALKRLELLAERARRLPEDCTKLERMAMIAEIDTAMRAMRAMQTDIRERLSRSRRTSVAANAYGRSAALNSNRR